MGPALRRAIESCKCDRRKQPPITPSGWPKRVRCPKHDGVCIEGAVYYELTSPLATIFHAFCPARTTGKGDKAPAPAPNEGGDYFLGACADGLTTMWLSGLFITSPSVGAKR